MEVFSTITSPVFSELVIVLTERTTVVHLPWERALFELLRTMSEIRPFELVFFLQVDDLDCQEGVRRDLVEGLDMVVAKGFLDFLDSPPTIR